MFAATEVAVGGPMNLTDGMDVDQRTRVRIRPLNGDVRIGPDATSAGYLVYSGEVVELTIDSDEVWATPNGPNTVDVDIMAWTE